MSDHNTDPYCVEFHLHDDDLPPEAMRDCFHPPRTSTLVHCIHCGEEYDSWKMVYRVTADSDGKVHGMWYCGIPGCDGAGFQFDIFPVDSNFVPDDDQPQGEWVSFDDDEDEDRDEYDENDISTHDDDCKCELCEEFRAEMEEWERKHPKPAADAHAAKPNENDPDVLRRKALEEDRYRLDAQMASLREPDGQVPLDDALADADDRENVALTGRTMMEIEARLGIRDPAELGPMSERKPIPLPPNWRELLAREDERIRGGGSGSQMGEDDIPF